MKLRPQLNLDCIGINLGATRGQHVPQFIIWDILLQTLPPIFSLCSLLCVHTNDGFLRLIPQHTTTVLRLFFRDHPGEPVPEENFWTFWCKGRLTEADTLTIRLGATPSGVTRAHLHHPHIFYGPDALPAAQPTVSKH